MTRTGVVRGLYSARVAMRPFSRFTRVPSEILANAEWCAAADAWGDVYVDARGSLIDVPVVVERAREGLGLPVGSLVDQVRASLGSDVEDFDVDGIVDALRCGCGLGDGDSIDVVDSGVYWDLVMRFVFSGV